LNNSFLGVDSNPVNSWDDLIPGLLLSLLGVSLAVGTVVALFVLHSRRKRRPQHAPIIAANFEPVYPCVPIRTGSLHRPGLWMTIRNRNLHSVQSALGLHNPKPCTWLEGFTGEQGLFISPPVNGWILVVGSDLPDPGEDIDVCFRFLLELSRKLGQVQFFNAHRVLNHHAWVHMEAGRVVRAYAWAGKTLWNQGIKTRAELDLGLKCFRYLEGPERARLGQSDVIATNTDKVPLLAARWSFDPAAVDERILERACGIAGKPSRLY
jgi:hypothetical protein